MEVCKFNTVLIGFGLRSVKHLSSYKFTTPLLELQGISNSYVDIYRVSQKIVQRLIKY